MPPRADTLARIPSIQPQAGKVLVDAPESSRFDMIELLRQALRRETLDLCIIPLGHALPASWILSGLANVNSAGRIYHISDVLYASKTLFILSV
jgi:hypothetical protein